VRSLVALALSALAAYDPGCGSEATDSSGTAGTSGRATIDVDALCTKLISECGTLLTPVECKKQYAPLRVSSACAAALKKGTCAELTSPSSALIRGCFPACSGTLATCNADGTITRCTDSGGSQVLDCAATCTADGFTYTGTCGTTYKDRTAAVAQCWCQ
jgi:hypothetical protein